jgi:hypothetical protein
MHRRWDPALALVVAALACRLAIAQDAPSEHFVIPAEMAPVHLARDFPLRLRTAVGDQLGTATLQADVDGVVRGEKKVDGVLSSNGSQSSTLLRKSSRFQDFLSGANSSLMNSFVL